jgi:hypothetical protein
MVGKIVVAFLRSAADRLSAIEAAGASCVQFYPSANEAALALSDSRVAAVILELQDDSGTDLAVIQRAIAQRVLPIPLLIRFDLKRGLIRKMLEHEATAYDVRFSLRGSDVFFACVSDLLASSEPRTARRPIIARLVVRARLPVLDIVVGAAMIGDRRSTVAQLADLCQQAGRTVEERLVDASFMGAKRLLMRMLTLHTLWRVSHLGWTAKRAAAAAGFQSTDVLSRRIERAVGHTLAELCHDRLFGDELAQLADDLT